MGRPPEVRLRGRRAVLGALAVLLGVLWWWAVLRLAFVPEGAGAVEGVVAAGGWGLSLLPVHAAGRGAAEGAGRGALPGRGFTRASRRRRSGGGSDPS
ncbi:hypothetical protein OG897_20370 [Streptomyces sp. NBC_00237]|uniref:hypothetical protein n=1 Tax=Streptomyces sp. NBC_00237 TaxID=2975687 RepID=UPI002255CDC5|nr:hypothetical protein [Streptomyces sp. NBC_00237]MCX5203802.1 hypothetical protein [Streptomyces sp. NBC_00237]